MNLPWTHKKDEDSRSKRKSQDHSKYAQPEAEPNSWGVAPTYDTGSTTLQEAGPSELEFVASFLTDVGSVRSQNQDAGLAASSGDRAILLVADGMGGHAGGAEASQVAVDKFAERLSQLNPGESPDVEGAFFAIAKEVSEVSPKGGTTLVIAVLDQSCIQTWHVGDSRAYIFREGTLSRLTTDHSWVQALVSSGKLTEAQAEVHPRRNVLTRAIGAGHDPAPEHGTVRVLPYDIVLLCSDGLHGVLGERDMRKVLHGFNYKDRGRFSQELERVSSTLVHHANHKGGPDNISVAMAIAVPK